MSKATTVKKTYILIRRGRAEEWDSVNPILKLGEPGYATDLNILKIGNGESPWKDLLPIGQENYSVSPDNNSLALNIKGELILYGFNEAENNQIPIKNSEGKISWVSVGVESLTGYIEDLKQNMPIVLTGGSASNYTNNEQGIFNSIICLRRDNDYNYKKIQETFIPKKGEVCLVDTAAEGLQVICGDGVHKFSELEYSFSLLIKGYFYNDLFYKDGAYLEPINGSSKKLYVDNNSGMIFIYNENTQKFISPTNIVNASDTEKGILKLYSTLGKNTDGTINQKTITDELEKKVELSYDVKEELLIFTK